MNPLPDTAMSHPIGASPASLGTGSAEGVSSLQSDDTKDESPMQSQEIAEPARTPQPEVSDSGQAAMPSEQDDSEPMDVTQLKEQAQEATEVKEQSPIAVSPCEEVTMPNEGITEAHTEADSLLRSTKIAPDDVAEKSPQTNDIADQSATEDAQSVETASPSVKVENSITSQPEMNVVLTSDQPSPVVEDELQEGEEAENDEEDEPDEHYGDDAQDETVVGLRGEFTLHEVEGVPAEETKQEETRQAMDFCLSVDGPSEAKQLDAPPAGEDVANRILPESLPVQHGFGEVSTTTSMPFSAESPSVAAGSEPSPVPSPAVSSSSFVGSRRSSAHSDTGPLSNRSACSSSSHSSASTPMAITSFGGRAPSVSADKSPIDSCAPMATTSLGGRIPSVSAEKSPTDSCLQEPAPTGVIVNSSVPDLCERKSPDVSGGICREADSDLLDGQDTWLSQQVSQDDISPSGNTSSSVVHLLNAPECHPSAESSTPSPCVSSPSVHSPSHASLSPAPGSRGSASSPIGLSPHSDNTSPIPGSVPPLTGKESNTASAAFTSSPQEGFCAVSSDGAGNTTSPSVTADAGMPSPPALEAVATHVPSQRTSSSDEQSISQPEELSGAPSSPPGLDMPPLEPMPALLHETREEHRSFYRQRSMSPTERSRSRSRSPLRQEDRE